MASIEEVKLTSLKTFDDPPTSLAVVSGKTAKMKEAADSDSVSYEYSMENGQITPKVKAVDINYASFCGSLFNVVNAALGAGLLGYAYAFAQMGLVLSLVVMVMLTILVAIGLVALAQAGKVTDCDTMAVSSRRLAGPVFEWLCIFLAFAFAWTTCIAFMQIVGAQVESFAYNLDMCVNPGNGEAPFLPWFAKREFVMIVSSLLIIYPLCLLRDMSSLSWASFIAIAACTYITIYVIVVSFLPRYENDDITDKLHEDLNADEDHPLKRLFGVLPSMFFGFQCHLSIIPTYASTRKDVRPRFPGLCFFASIICFLLYTAVGVAGSKTFGKNTESSILDNLHKDDLWALAGKVLVAFAVITSYPILSFVGRGELVNLLERIALYTKWNMAGNVFFCSEARTRFTLGSIWFFSTLAPSVLAKSLGPVLNIAGSSAGLLMFLYPGMMMMKLSALCHEDTVTEAIKNLPDSPDEHSPDTWVYGMREERIDWIKSKTVRKGIWVTGLMFCVFSVVVFFFSLGIVIYDIATKSQSAVENICSAGRK